MCGIVGLITSFSNGFSLDEANTLRDMAYIDALRGTDATGLMYGTNQGDVQIHKESSPAWEFLSTKEWTDSKNEIARCGKWAVVHNRAATRGAKVDKNAHPFNIEDKLILVQNGTYRGEHKHLKDTEVDTEACAHTLKEAESIEAGLKKINAAYAFVWYDVEASTLHLIRNSERPLFLAETATGSYVFASEPGMIYAAAARNTLSIKVAAKPLEVGKLYKFKMSGPRCTLSEEALDITYKAPETQVHPFRTPQTVQHGRRSFGWVSPGEAARTVLTGSEAGKAYNSKELSSLRTVVYSNRNRSYFVEGFDYCPVNGQASDNSQWYIFGTIMDLNGPLDGIPCMWTIDCKDNSSLPDYVAGRWFEVKLDIVIQHGNYYADDFHAVITCNSAEPVNGTTPDYLNQNVH